MKKKKIWQYSKTQIVQKDQKLKLWQTKNSNSDKTQTLTKIKLKLLQNKNLFVTPQKLKLW